MPWWSEHEDRTVIFLANSVSQRVTFYIAPNEIPNIYKDVWLDQNEMFVIRPTDEGYVVPNPGVGSAYYLRMRANYTLSAYIDPEPYSYYFWAFTQPTGDTFIDLYGNEPTVGMAFKDQNTFYRHYLTDKQHTVVVTLKSFPSKGKPKLLVKMKSDVVYPVSNKPESFDSKVEIND